MLLRGPQYVSWNYTYACNFNCTHCYSRAKRYPRELSSADYGDIVEQFVDAHIFKVGLGGGEPLIRSDCMDMLTRMGQAGIDTNVTSNGWFLDAALAERLRQARLGTLYISIDSAVAAKHDAFRRKEGSFERALAAARHAAAVGLRVKFSTVITAVNLSEIADLVALGERIGIYGIEFKRFRPAGNGVATTSQYALGREGEMEMRTAIDAARRTSFLMVQLIYGFEDDGGVDSGCPCGVRSICLRPNGDVCPCAYSETVIGNLRDTKLVDLWRFSHELASMRAQNGCAAIETNPNPSNPALSVSKREAVPAAVI